MLEAEIIEDEFKAPVLQDVKYPVTQVDLNKLLEQYAEIPKIDPDGENAAEQYKFVNVGRKAFVKARTSIEKVRKELKAPSLEYGKKVDSIAKEFQALISGKEQELTLQCRIVEDNEKRKQEEYEQAERDRRDVIRLKIEHIKNLPLDHYNSSSAELTKVLESFVVATEEVYQEFLEDARQALETTIAQLQSARENKVKAEQAEKIQAENEARLVEEQRIKDETIVKERAELEAEKGEIRRQRDELEKEKREQQEAIDLKNAEIEADRLGKEQEEEAKKHNKMQKEQFEEKRKQALLNLQEVLNESDKENSFEDRSGVILNAIIDNKIDHIRWEA